MVKVNKYYLISMYVLSIENKAEDNKDNETSSWSFQNHDCYCYIDY